MWLHLKQTLALAHNSRLWKRQKMSSLAILLAIVATIFAEVNAANIPSTDINNSNNKSASAIASVSNISNVDNVLAEKVNQFKLKYNATLLNPSFLSFVNDCIDVVSAAKKAEVDQQLCLLYFDMIYNLNEKCPNELKNQDSVTKILIEYDNETITNQFCSQFPNELKVEVTVQPFAQSRGLDATKYMKNANFCVFKCVEQNEMSIKPLCKLISGGYRLIHLQSKKQSPQPPIVDDQPQPNNTDTKKVTTSTQPIGQVISDIPSKASPDAGANKVPANNASSTAVSKPTQSNVAQNVSPSEASQPIAAKDEKEVNKKPKSEQESKKTENVANTIPLGANPADQQDQESLYNEQKEENYDNPDDDSADEPGTRGHADEQEEPHNDFKSSNNMQSPLSADINGFREDKDSSFFSYFMFFMFVIVTLYVGYHNKSKILALLIEGRRSRSYSRSSGRRKQHSAEYRKLDSNLEEAIQSGGGQVLTTQIIY